MNKKLKTDAVDYLFDAILSLKNRDECYSFFEDLCTVNELLSLSQRFEVAAMLKSHKTYLEIADKTGASKKTADTKKTDKNMPQLSDKAKALLQDLKKQYSNMDFFVAEYDSEEEAASYLSRGSKDYSVLIDPEELERMAEDEDVKKQNLALLDEAVGKLGELKEELKKTGKEDEVVTLGVSIGKDGKVSYFAELEKAGERQKEFVDKIREDKKEAAKEAAEKAAKGWWRTRTKSGQRC